MKTNFHTHTMRCGHASGTDEEYIQAALARGFDALGFSDHVPWPYRGGFTNEHVRMRVERLDEYVASMRALREKYAGQIEIYAGFECEYFPEYADWFSGMIREKELDYVILGQHFDLSDETGIYFGRLRTAEQLRRYVDQVARGLATGLFTYLAHPDLFMRGYPRFDENCRAAALDLCAACREADVPMEYNLHARYESELFGDSYPNAQFFELVREQNVPVVVGLDAHSPEEIRNPAQWDIAQREMKAFGALHLDMPRLRSFSRR